MIRAAALAAAFFLAGGAIPVLGGIAMFLAPAPIMIYAVGRPKPNLRAIIAVLIAAGLGTLFMGGATGLASILFFGLSTPVAWYMLVGGSSFGLIAAACAGAVGSALVVAVLPVCV